MDPKAVTAAMIMVAGVRRHAADLRTVREFGEHQGSWHDALMNVGSGFDRLKSGAGRKGLSFEWFRTIQALRETDPLLRYLAAARNAETHTHGSSLGFVPHQFHGLFEGTFKTEQRMFHNGERFIVTPVTLETTADPEKFTFTPETVRPLPVVERRRGKETTLPPPVVHLSAMLRDASAPGILEVAANALKDIAWDAQSFVPPNIPVKFDPLPRGRP